MAALDRVGRQRERRARKSDQRCASGQLALHLTDGVEHVAERFARVESPDTRQVVLRLQRMLDGRSLAADEVEAHTHRLERQQQIRKQDGGVDVDAANRLEGHLCRQVGGTAEVEEGIALAQGPVLAHIAAGLAHEPYGRRVDRLQPAGLNESSRRVGQWSP